MPSCMAILYSFDILKKYNMSFLPFAAQVLRKKEAGEMAQNLKALVAFTEDWGSVPSTHIGELTTTNN